MNKNLPNVKYEFTEFKFAIKAKITDYGQIVLDLNE